jgi:peptidoglycan/xylan/chitin deacetylase (PgdA/CDA1 family)
LTVRAVLTFHSLDDSAGVLSYPPREFQRLIERLARTSVPVLTFEQLLRASHGIALTFDDGMRSVHREALPVLRDHGFPAHLFLTTGVVDGHNRWQSQRESAPHFEMMSWAEVEDCAHSGISIECHTVSHPDLRKLTPPEILAECEQADAQIAARIGRRPRLFAFPYGAQSAMVRATLADRYEACFTTRLAYLGAQVDQHAVPRLDTYYLRSSARAARVLRTPVRMYIGARAMLRTLRGST